MDLTSGDFPESYLMMAARRSYTSVVSWLFPQMASQPKPTEVVNIEEDEEEIQVLEVVDGKKANESSSKNIKYDPLPSFKGFTTTQGSRIYDPLSIINLVGKKNSNAKSLITP